MAAGVGTFDLLGFTLFWRKTRGGHWGQDFRTREARIHRAIGAIIDFCRRHRHEPVKEQHASLCRCINGHFNYFGANGNVASLARFVRAATPGSSGCGAGVTVRA